MKWGIDQPQAIAPDAGGMLSPAEADALLRKAIRSCRQNPGARAWLRSVASQLSSMSGADETHMRYVMASRSNRPCGIK